LLVLFYLINFFTTYFGPQGILTRGQTFMTPHPSQPLCLTTKHDNEMGLYSDMLGGSGTGWWC
jgi:hypothetical protein